MNKNTVIRLVLVIGILGGSGYLIADGILSNNRVQAQIDKGAGGPLVRSVQMSDAEVSARQALGRFAEYKNHYRGDCTGITDLEVLFAKESDSLSDAEVKCLKQVMASPASFTKITSKWFEGEPEPRLIQTVIYRPHEHGVNGLTINSLPFSKKGYHLRNKSGTYYMPFANNGTQQTGWIGFVLSNFNVTFMRKLEIQDVKHYGIPLTTFTGDSFNIHLNIPRETAFYSNLNGELTCEIWTN